MNKVWLSGRLTASPELKSTPAGKYVSEFTLAVDRMTATGDKQTDFVRCSVWNKQAENLCKFKGKGDRIGVSGSIRVDRYKGKDGKDHDKVYVSVIEVEYLDSRKQAEERVIVEPDEPRGNDDGDDLPF